MKHLLAAGICLLLFPLSISAQQKETGITGKDLETATYPVSGNCNMCKARIETAAYGKGVRHAEWDKAQQTLRVTYRNSKTDAGAILKRVALAGHDADSIPAAKDAYEKLPACCSYKTDSNIH